MEQFYYLPNEQVNYINYPELRTYRADIVSIIAYAEVVATAVSDYQKGKKDKIDLNTDEVQQYINLCRSTSEVLGKAPKVCFDVLMELRNVQVQLHGLMHLRRKFGTKYIGEPTVTGKAEVGI